MKYFLKLVCAITLLCFAAGFLIEQNPFIWQWAYKLRAALVMTWFFFVAIGLQLYLLGERIIDVLRKGVEMKITESSGSMFDRERKDFQERLNRIRDEINAIENEQEN